MKHSFLSKNLINLYQKAVTNIHDLRYIFFEITRKCNLKCLHCGSDCIQDSTVPDMKIATVKKLLTEIKTQYNSKKITVVLSGGEPLCFKNVFKLGSEISHLEFPWGMVTNGYEWNARTIKQARLSGLQTISISLDGLEDTHNWLRGKPDSFIRAVNCIKMLTNDPFYQAMDVITCVNKKNINQLDKIYNLIIKLGVKAWRLVIISPIGRASEPELFLSGAEMCQLFDKIIELKSKNEISVSYSCSGFLGRYEQKVREANFFCKAGINIAGIMINGDILACPNIDRSFMQGNVTTDSFVEVWENSYKLFRDRLWMKNGQCKECREWKLCKGNSFHLRDGTTKETKFCHYNHLN